jgi:hypothetical protein
VALGGVTDEFGQVNLGDDGGDVELLGPAFVENNVGDVEEVGKVDVGFVGGGGKGGFDPYQAALDSNSCPNPYGRHGGPPHTGLIDSLRLLFEQLGFDVSPNEKKVLIPREDKYRYPDLTVDTGKEIIYVQVGKSKANGDQIAREQRAIDDLRKTGNMVWFFPYDD